LESFENLPPLGWFDSSFVVGDGEFLSGKMGVRVLAYGDKIGLFLITFLGVYSS
jgi:hypothetical protein